LCCYGDYFGAWDEAETIADLIERESAHVERSRGGSWVFGLAANVRAFSGDPSCRTLYERAYSLATEEYDRYFLHFRAATAEVKRLGSRDRAADRLGRARCYACCIA